VIAAAGIVTGVVGGFVLAKLVGSYLMDVQLPGVLPLLGAALLLVAAAILASLIPAARAARVNVMTALRSD
jgi:putative ABC transport system permease protein